jgi:nanoRNase/pAp phosphatase (c-di-AMP/oligoRNAs hydrolase)
MTAFVESCAKTVTGSARAVARRAHRHPKALQLIRALSAKKRVLITTHDHPDPDAIASCQALSVLLSDRLGKDTEVKVSFKGGVGGGLNETFANLTDLKPIPWDESALTSWDAIVLLDTQPAFANNPLPAELTPLVVIDHHRGGRKLPANCAFCDIRPDVGAVSSIVFSYFMELELKIAPDLAATLLYAIESDLAGAAGQPGELDNIALSSLTLMADTRKLYKMRYLDLPQNFFVSYAQGLNNAILYDSVVMSHLENVPSPERPAVIADFLLRFDQAKWSLVTGVMNGQLVMSLRTYPGQKMSAAELMKRLVRGLGGGGGHRAKAGGGIKLTTGTQAEIDRLREILRRRLLRNVGIKGARGHRLIPRFGEGSPARAANPSPRAASRNTTPATPLAAAPPASA